MLLVDGIDVSEGVNVNKQVCQNSVIFVTILLFCKFQPIVCSRCHDLLMMSMNMLNFKSADYRCIIIRISKNKQNKQNIIKHKQFIFIYKKG